MAHGVQRYTIHQSFIGVTDIIVGLHKKKFGFEY